MTSLYTHIPTIEELKKEIENNGLENTIKIYSKYEWLIGDHESIKFLEEKNEELKKQKKENI